MSIFGDISPEAIGQSVKDQITAFDQNIKGISDLLSFGLADDRYSQFYNVARDINLAIGGVCLAIAVILAYIAIVKEGLSLRGDWKQVVTILLRLAITKGLIDTSTQFITWIYSFPTKITQLVLEHTTGKGAGTLSSIFKPEDIAKGLGITKDSGIFELFVAKQYANILGFSFYMLSLAILIIALARVLKIYTLLAFSSLAFSKIPLNGFDGCRDYIKEMCALGLQGGIIAVTVTMFQIANVSISKLANTGTWGSLGGIIVLGISMFLLIFKSEELARKVI